MFQSISPGLVNTEFTTVASADFTAEKLHETHPHLQPQDLAEAVLYVLGTPPRVQASSHIIHGLWNPKVHKDSPIIPLLSRVNTIPQMF